MKEITYTFFLLSLLIFCYGLGRLVAYWWLNRVSEKQLDKIMKWEMENPYSLLEKK